MYCRRCGRELNDDWSFCMSCGTPVSQTATHQSNTKDPAIQQTSADSMIQTNASPACTYTTEGMNKARTSGNVKIRGMLRDLSSGDEIAARQYFYNDDVFASFLTYLHNVKEDLKGTKRMVHSAGNITLEELSRRIFESELPSELAPNWSYASMGKFFNTGVNVLLIHHCSRSFASEDIQRNWEYYRQFWEVAEVAPWRYIKIRGLIAFSKTDPEPYYAPYQGTFDGLLLPHEVIYRAVLPKQKIFSLLVRKGLIFTFVEHEGSWYIYAFEPWDYLAEWNSHLCECPQLQAGQYDFRSAVKSRYAVGRRKK